MLTLLSMGIYWTVVECTSYLGIKTVCQLSWNSHVLDFSEKLAFEISRLYGSSRTWYRKHYSSHNYNHHSAMFWLCNEHLGSYIQVKEIYKIQRLQKYAARIVVSSFDYINCQGKDVAKELNGWTSSKDVSVLPCSFLLVWWYSKLWCKQSYHHRPHSLNAFPPPVSSQLSTRSFKYQGAILWNSLPHNLKNISNLSNFKNEVKKNKLILL